MDWIYFVILATFCWAMGNIMDKYLIDKRIKNPLALFILFRIVFVVPLIFLIFFLDLGIPNAPFFVLIFISAAFMISGILFYYKIVETEEISVSIPLFQFIPIFTLFTAFFVLAERLAAADYLGFLILISGGFIISVKKSESGLRAGKVLWLAMLSSLLFSLSYVVAKFIMTSIPFWDTFIWIWIFESILTIPFAFSGKIRNNLKYHCKRLNRKDWTIVSINTIICVIASASYYFAIKMGPISLVQASENMQMIFVFLLALLLTVFFPHIMKERFDIRALAQKIIGMMLIMTGVLVIQLL